MLIVSLHCEEWRRRLLIFVLPTHPIIFRKNTTIGVHFHEGNIGSLVEVINNVPFTFFNQFQQTDGLGFDQILEKRYLELKEVLTSTKKITESIRLNENDIAEFDFFIPVYLKKYAMYFYVNKISNYVDGQKTKVELIRI